MPTRRLNLMIFVLVLGMFPTILNTTLVNIALDHLHTVFHAPLADTQWIVTAYLLAYVAVIPVSGWASERFGTRRVWMFAISAFMIGSLLCGFAWSLPSLIVFRLVQGIGGGMVTPVTLTILSRAAGKPRMGAVIATIGFVGQLAPILGPIVGGSLVDSIGWHWLFFLNVPIDIIGLVLVRLIVPAGAKDRSRSFDVLGFVLLTPGVVAVAYGVSRAAGTAGFSAPDVWVPLVIGAALLVGFVLRALNAKGSALLDVRVFSRRSFGLSSMMTFVAGFSTYALIFLLPLFYQAVRGDSIATTGLLLIPQGLGTMCFILLNRVLVTRVDTRIVIAGGVVLTMIGVLPFALAGATGGDILLLAGQFVQGFGLGAISIPIMTLAFTSLSHDETPRGSAAFNVVKQVGAPFGVTVIAVVLQGYASANSGAGQILAAFNATFWWVFGLSAIPLLLAFFLPAPTRTPEPVPEPGR
ncbi:MAG: DHA2 family efflux MFS transporter permease subunit [Rhodoglobus sp.]